MVTKMSSTSISVVGHCTVIIIFKSLQQSVSNIDSIIIFRGYANMKMEKRFIDVIASGQRDMEVFRKEITPFAISYAYAREHGNLDSLYEGLRMRPTRV